LILGIINYALFYLGWFLCLYSATHGKPWIAIFSGLFVTAFFFFIAKEKKPLVLTLLYTLFIGFWIDTSFKYFHLISYETSWSFFRGGAPFWILSIYALLATSIDTSLLWLSNKVILSMILGFVGGLLSYRGAALVGAITFEQNIYVCLVIIGIVWAIFLPSIFKIHKMVSSKSR
jgi:hypothetical protein